jgi:hypothetical protein
MIRFCHLYFSLPDQYNCCIINVVVEIRNLGAINRRGFIGLISSYSFLFFLTPNNYAFSASNQKGTLPSPADSIKGSFKFFNPHQAQVIEEVTSLIIPSDNSPGAREAGVVFEIDKTIVKNQRLKNSYAKGIEALHLMAKQLVGKDSFLDLNQDEMIEILNIAYASKSLSSRGGTSTQYGSMLPGILLINHLIRQTIEIFYTSEVGWEVVGYQGPPQWKGNLGYDKCGF